MEKVVIDTNVLINFFLKTDLTGKAKDTIKYVFNELHTYRIHEHS